MLQLARNGYSADLVKKVLHYGYGERKMYYRYNLLDENNTFIRTLTNVKTGSVAYDTKTQIKRTAKFSIRDDGSIDFVTQRIQPWAWLLMPDGGFAKFPLGVFLLSTAPRQADIAKVVTRAVDGYDLLQILVDDKVIDTYYIAAGANYISAIKTLLIGAGITQMNLTPSSATLPAALSWAGGTPKLTIINDLLNAINYRELWFDANGVVQAIPYLTPAQRASEYTYADDDESVIFPDVMLKKDLFGVPNVWVLTVSEPNRPPLRSVYTNSNVSSETSTVKRDRKIVKYMTNVQAPNQATLDALAEKQAFLDSQIYEEITFTSANMPIHSDYDVYTINSSVLGVNDKFSETAWSMDLSDGSRMKHTAQRVVTV